MHFVDDMVHNIVHLITIDEIIHPFDSQKSCWSFPHWPAVVTMGHAQGGWLLSGGLVGRVIQRHPARGILLVADKNRRWGNFENSINNH